MPKFVRHRLGWRCACDRFYGVGPTRAVAFENWRAAAMGSNIKPELDDADN